MPKHSRTLVYPTFGTILLMTSSVAVLLNGRR